MEQLVDLLSINPKIQIELKYATADNFTGKRVYDFSRCLLLKPVAVAVSRAQEEAERYGLGLKVWDGYRPIAAQWKFWELVPDERYVGDPRKGGRHTRGTAVDLTLIDAKGEELEMPSLFDDFSERAAQNYLGASKEAIQNREFLRKLMEDQGFTGVATEWWHFDYAGWEGYPPIEFDVKTYPH